MLHSKTMKLSEAEILLQEAIKEIQCGEMYGVEIPQQKLVKAREVSGNFLSLLEELRDGVTYVDVLTIHQGEPVMMEIDCKINDFRCRKKTKFPTE